MSGNCVFEFFETLCTELTVKANQTFSEDDLEPQLVDDLLEHFEETSTSAAFGKALVTIETHFLERNGKVPYEYDLERREFLLADADYAEFVASSRAYRGVAGDRAKSFEIESTRRLRQRLSGDLYRVGTPRNQVRRKREFSAFLVTLGFGEDCLEPRDQDGGLDILWLPPLGSVPIRPVVSFQCKNAYFDEDDANASTGRAERTLRRHSHLRADHLKLVIFNDYIVQDEFVGRAVGWTFIPLGLSDLATPTDPAITQFL